MRRLATLLLALCFTSLVHAQDDHVGFLLTGTFRHNGNASRGYVTDLNPGPPATPVQYTSFESAGLGGGIDIHIASIGPTSLALFAQGSNSGGSQNAGSVVGGLQVALRRRIHGLRPYAQAGYGLYGTTASAVDPYVSPCLLCSLVLGSSTRSTTYKGVEFFAGVDYRLARFVDFRAIELGFGSEKATGVGYATGNLTIFDLSTGLVVHF